MSGRITSTYQSGFYAPGRGGRPLYPELWTGCVGAWNPGLGNSGLVLRDWSGRGNNCVLTSGLTWGVSGGQFSTDYVGTVKQQFTTKSLVGQRSVTASVWVRRNGSGGLYSIPFGVSDSSQAGWRFFQSSVAGTYRWSVRNYGDATQYIEFPAIPDLTWTHLLGTFDGYKIRAFINGVELAEKNSPMDILWNSNVKGTFYNNDGWGAYSGAIADAAIFSYAVSNNVARLLATRPGIAYELSSKTYFLPSTTKAYLRQRTQIIGGGLR